MGDASDVGAEVADLVAIGIKDVCFLIKAVRSAVAADVPMLLIAVLPCVLGLVSTGRRPLKGGGGADRVTFCAIVPVGRVAKAGVGGGLQMRGVLDPLGPLMPGGDQHDGVFVGDLLICRRIGEPLSAFADVVGDVSVLCAGAMSPKRWIMKE